MQSSVMYPSMYLPYFDVFHIISIHLTVLAQWYSLLQEIQLLIPGGIVAYSRILVLLLYSHTILIAEVRSFYI